MLTYVFKNENLSKDVRVSAVRGTSNLLVANMCWMVAFRIHVFDTSLFYLIETPIRTILRFGNHFYHECFLQHFEGCAGVSFFHLNNFDNEVGTE